MRLYRKVRLAKNVEVDVPEWVAQEVERVQRVRLSKKRMKFLIRSLGRPIPYVKRKRLMKSLLRAKTEFPVFTKAVPIQKRIQLVRSVG